MFATGCAICTDDLPLFAGRIASQLDESKMGFKSACAAAIAAWMLCGITQAGAGYWNYGCKASLGDTALIFDRNAFLIMPKALAKGDIAGLVSSTIFAFDADDNNSGLMPVMKFTWSAYPEQKIVLTEKSSKAISERKGHVGTREKSTVTYKKTYHYERIGYRDEPEAVDVAMECIEYMLTAP
jgi:hypothetical protein